MEDGDSTYYYYETVLGLDNEVEINNEVLIYPNPSNGKFEISAVKDISKLEIFSTNGELIAVFDNKGKVNTRFHVDLSWKPSGLYLIKGTSEKTSFYQKIIIR